MHDARGHQWLKDCVLQEGKAGGSPERGRRVQASSYRGIGRRGQLKAAA